MSCYKIIKITHPKLCVVSAGFVMNNGEKNRERESNGLDVFMIISTINFDALRLHVTSNVFDQVFSP